MLVEIFCQIDDFCKFFEKEANIKLIGSEKKVGRTRQLTTSEILTIIVYFHASGFKNFKTYYEIMIRGYLCTDFSGSISYNRFIELRQESMFLLMLFVKIKKDEYSLQSTKLRSMTAFVAHVCSAVIAYSLRPNKPSIFRTKMLISID